MLVMHSRYIDFRSSIIIAKQRCDCANNFDEFVSHLRLSLYIYMIPNR